MHERCSFGHSVQCGASHASQVVVDELTHHGSLSRAGRHWPGSPTKTGRFVPFDRLRQHTTLPGVPQVECSAQRITAPRHDRFRSTACAVVRAQLT
jgi:hypothetical protein